jgi:hypothetical protein
MDALQALPLHQGWIYEVLICTYDGDTPHAAPFGVWTHDHVALETDMYEGSHTLRNLRARGEFVVGFPAGVATLHDALFAPQRLAFAPARHVRAPVLAGAQASLELIVETTMPFADGLHVRALPRALHVEADVTPLNRGEGLLLESLVLATRRDAVGDQALLTTLSEHHRVVRKVAPGSDADRTLAELVRMLERPS